MPQQNETLCLYCTGLGFISKNEEYNLEKNILNSSYLVVALLFCFGVLQAIGYRSLLVKSLVYKSILPIDIILLELKRMKCLKLLRKNDNPFKDKLIASFKNPKLYPSPLQNFYKRGTRMLSYLTGVVETV